MAEKSTQVDQWLERETPRIRRALEHASRHFDEKDNLTVNTLEAVYARESSFGTMLRDRGSTAAAGHFHFKPDTAKQYGLSVSKQNDQRFDIAYASSAAAGYLKDLDALFSAIENTREREKFVLGAYNGGQTRVTEAQYRAEQAGKNPRLWNDVAKFLESEKTSASKVDEMQRYVEKVLLYKAEFAIKSPASKKAKQRKPGKSRKQCENGHWVTIDERPVRICD